MTPSNVQFHHTAEWEQNGSGTELYTDLDDECGRDWSQDLHYLYEITCELSKHIFSLLHWCSVNLPFTRKSWSRYIHVNSGLLLQISPLKKKKRSGVGVEAVYRIRLKLLARCHDSRGPRLQHHTPALKGLNLKRMEIYTSEPTSSMRVIPCLTTIQILLRTCCLWHRKVGRYCRHSIPSSSRYVQCTDEDNHRPC